MRKNDTIRSLLRGADDKALEQISTVCPAAGKQTEKRLYKRLMQRIAEPGSGEDAVSVTYEVGTVRRSVLHIALSVAACAVLVTVTGLFFLLQKPERDPSLQLAVETTTPGETETAFAELDEDRPAETVQEIVTGTDIDLPWEHEPDVSETQPAEAETLTASAPGKTDDQKGTNTRLTETVLPVETARPTESTTPAATEPVYPPDNPPDLIGAQCCYLGWDAFYSFNVPVVITSLQELKDFYGTYFYPYSSEDWNDSYSPDGFSQNFKYVGAKYDDAYFARYGLVLLFCQTPVAEECLEVTGITVDAQNHWTIHVKEHPVGFTSQTTTWCLFVETNKGVEAANGIDASITKVQDTAKKIGESALEKMRSGIYSPGRVIEASEFMDGDITDAHAFAYLCFVNEHTVLLRIDRGPFEVNGYLITDGTVSYSGGDYVSVPSYLYFDGDQVYIEWADDRLYYFSAGT